MKVNIEGKEFIQCESCIATTTVLSREAYEHWDWFTGELARTYHWCPKHKDSFERKAIWAVSGL